MKTKPQAQSFQKVALIPLYGWLILAALLVWNAWVFWPRQQASTEITYSDLIDQVNAGNVSQVTFIGNDISGTLIHPVTGQSGTPSTTYATFHTIIPQVGGDTGLVSLLVWHHVSIAVKPLASLWLLFLWTGVPAFLLILMLVFLILKATHRYPGGMKRGLNSSQKYTVQRPQESFSDVGGDEEAKDYLRKILDNLRDPEKLKNMAWQTPKGVLLVGQSGIGKTLLVNALAGEAGAPLISIHGSTMGKMNLSDLRALSNLASKEPLSIILIDHLEDAIHMDWDGERTSPDHHLPLHQIFEEFDGLQASRQVIIIGETNRPDKLDPDLLDASWFDHQLSVGLPERVAREEILKIHTRNLHLAKNVNLGVIARTTTGLSGADLAMLCRQAALQSAQKGSDQVTMADFEVALDQLLLGSSQKLILNEEERRIVAYHQAGHVLVAWLTPGSDPIRKINIMQDHHTSGIDDLLSPESHYFYSKSSILARLAVLLAGRAAEEVILGEVTNGSEYDLIEATRLARRMIARWGMGRMGPMAFDTLADQALITADHRQPRDYSEATAERIDQEVQELLVTTDMEMRKLLTRNKTQLDDLVEALIRDEVIHQGTILHILGARPLTKTGESQASVTVPDLQHSEFRP